MRLQRRQTSTKNLAEYELQLISNMNHSSHMQVQMVFSDKTGTLTRNEMTFQVASIRGNRVNGTNHIDLQAAVPIFLALQSIVSPYVSLHSQKEKNSATQRFMQVLVLCHSLVPCRDSQGQLQYRTPSPDESALHTWAMSNGFRFIRREADQLTYLQGGDAVICYVGFRFFLT